MSEIYIYIYIIIFYSFSGGWKGVQLGMVFSLPFCLPLVIVQMRGWGRSLGFLC